MHPTSLNKMQAFVEAYLKEFENSSLFILDVGSQRISGNPTYRPFFNKPRWKYLGLDMIQGQNVDIVVKDPYNWLEIEDNFFDVVISGQAFEHIEFPWLTIKEIFRILKPGGLACIITPSSGPEHKHPYDCWRIYPDGMIALARWGGFRAVEVFTDWGLDPWRDTFGVFQKPLISSQKISPFEEFSNKEVALKVYIDAFKDKPQNPEYYGRAVNLLKAKGEIKKAKNYIATAISMFPQNLWLRQRAVELYLDIEPSLAIEHAIFLLRSRPITADNVKLLGKIVESIDKDTRDFLVEQLPDDINQLRQFAHHSENQKVYLFAEECWRKISEANYRDINAKLMHALMPRGYNNINLSKERFGEILQYQFSNNILSRTTIIQHLINKSNYNVYVEIGVERGLNFFQINALLKIGIDPDFRIPGGFASLDNVRFYPTNSNEFFKNPPSEILNMGIDIAFVDGLHTYEQSLRDVENSLKYLNPNGVIVMHDCLPRNEADAMPTLEEAKKHPDFKNTWTGDVYKTILHLRSLRHDLYVCVIDTDFGIGIIKIGEPESMLALTAQEIANFTFSQLQADKEKLLNLKPKEWFFQWLKER